MPFKQMNSAVALALLGALAMNCGGDTVDDQSPRVGLLPVKSATSFSASSAMGVKEGTAIIMDQQYNQIVELQMEPFAVLAKYPIPSRVKAEQIWVGPDNAYFIAVAEQHFAFVYRDGSVKVDPINIFGRIRSAAFDVATGRLVIEDAFHSLALVQLDQAGQVAAAWVGGPLLDDSAALLAGAMLPNGSLLVSRSDGNLSRVDFEKSISQQAWVIDTIEPQFEAIEQKETTQPEKVVWLSPAAQTSELVLGRTERRVFLMDVATGEMVEEVQVDAIVGHYDQSVGHVIVDAESDGTIDVYWAADGKLRRQVVKLSIGAQDSEPLLRSVINPDQNAVSLVTDSHPRQVVRVELDSSRVISVNAVPDDSEVAVGSSHLIFFFGDNSLGKAERHNLGKAIDKQVLQGFNLELARKRW